MRRAWIRAAKLLQSPKATTKSGAPQSSAAAPGPPAGWPTRRARSSDPPRRPRPRRTRAAAPRGARRPRRAAGRGGTGCRPGAGRSGGWPAAAAARSRPPARRRGPLVAMPDFSKFFVEFSGWSGRSGGWPAAAAARSQLPARRRGPLVVMLGVSRLFSSSQAGVAGQAVGRQLRRRARSCQRGAEAPWWSCLASVGFFRALRLEWPVRRQASGCGGALAAASAALTPPDARA